MNRARMRPCHWEALSNFDWAARAKERWTSLSESDRLIVLAAARAEIAANKAYNKAATRMWVLSRK